MIIKNKGETYKSVFVVKNEAYGVFSVVFDEKNAISFVSMLNENEIEKWNKSTGEFVMCVADLPKYLIWEFVEQK